MSATVAAALPPFPPSVLFADEPWPDGPEALPLLLHAAVANKLPATTAVVMKRRALNASLLLQAAE